MKNNISHHAINEETRFKVDKEKHEAKKRKFRPKTKIQRLKGVWYILTAVWVVCQGISALLAATGFYHLAATNLNGNSFLTGSTVLCFCIGLEWAFNKLNKIIAQQKYDDKTSVSPILYGLVLVFGLVYAGSTFVGTPYAVLFLAASPNYNDIEQIKVEHDVLIKSDTAFWNSQITKKESSTNAFVALNTKFDNKLGKERLRSDAIKPHRAMVDSLDALNNNKLTVLAMLKNNKQNEVSKAEEENEVMKSDHFAWCSSFGWGLSFVSLFCIVVFLLPFSWCQGYERDELKDNDSILNQLEEAKKKEEAQERAEIEKIKAAGRKVIEKDKEEELPKVVVNEPSTPMGFATATIKEGDIVKGEGRKSDRVYVMVKDELRAMTKGEVNTLKKGQSTPERIKHLEMLRNKLN